MRKISQNGLNFIKQFEGLKLTPYLDSVNKPTIGYGTTFYENAKPVTMGDAPINEARASAILEHVANDFGASICRLIGSPLIDSISQNKYDALLSFGYNVGIGKGGLGGSTLLKLVKANPEDPAIKTEFLRWNKAGGKVLAGLTARRQAEAILYFKQ